MMLKKVCKICHRELDISEFYMTRLGKYYGRCRDCKNTENRNSYARLHKVKDGVKQDNRGRLVDHKGVSCKLYWPESKIKDFQRLFPTSTNEELAVKFNCSVRTITRRAREYNLQKDQQWLLGVWEKGRKVGSLFLKIYKDKNSANAMEKTGYKTWFGPSSMEYLSPEERTARIKKGWETRRRNAQTSGASQTQTL